MTQNDIKNEIKQDIERCKTFEEMIDKVVHYIANNFKPKQNKTAQPNSKKDKDYVGYEDIVEETYEEDWDDEWLDPPSNTNYENDNG